MCKGYIIAPLSPSKSIGGGEVAPLYSYAFAGDTFLTSVNSVKHNIWVRV